MGSKKKRKREARRTSNQTPPAEAKRAAARPTISVCMIVRDEEEFLEECLSSVGNVADEIVVVDTGSTDRTVQIAESHGALVYTHNWNDNFSEARNKSIDLAKGDWVLILDADERLDEASKSVILDAVRDDRYDLYRVCQRSWTSDSHGPDIVNNQTYRLWRNRPYYRYRGRVHESITGAIKESGGNTAALHAVIHHLGYRPETARKRCKYQRNTRLVQAELEQRPHDLHYIYHQAMEFYVNGELDKALPFFEQAAALISPEQETAPTIYADLSSIQCSLGDPQKALATVRSAEDKRMRHPELAFSKGRSLLALSRFREAQEAFQRAIRLGQSREWLGDVTVSTYKANWGLAAANLGLGNYETAIRFGLLALAEKPDHAATHQVLADAQARLDRWDESEKHLKRVLELEPGDVTATMQLAAIRERQERYPEAQDLYASLVQSGFDSAELRLRMGVDAEAAGDPDSAEEHYVRAIELAADCMAALNNLGLLRAARGHVSEGIQCLAKAIETCPDYANSYFNTGDLLYSAGDYKAAAEFYDDGLLRSPQYAPGFFTLGNCYFQMGAYKAAAMAYRRALALRPDYAEAQHNLQLVEQAEAA